MDVINEFSSMLDENLTAWADNIVPSESQIEGKTFDSTITREVQNS